MSGNEVKKFSSVLLGKASHGAEEEFTGGQRTCLRTKPGFVIIIAILRSLLTSKKKKKKPRSQRFSGLCP